jgi:hypothetical protein
MKGKGKEENLFFVIEGLPGEVKRLLAGIEGGEDLWVLALQAVQ